MTNPSEPRTPDPLYHAAAPIRVAAVVTAFAIAAIYVLQVVTSLALSTPGALIVTFSATAMGVAAAAKDRSFRLGVSAAPPRFWIAAALIGLSTWYVDLTLVTWLGPPGDSPLLESSVKHAPGAVAVIAFAIAPAIAEELVFRGVLARSLARRSITTAVPGCVPRQGFPRVTALPLRECGGRSLPTAIIASSLVFSLYHLLPAQVVATFPLGLALATLAVRSDSVLPGMLAHFLNNAVVLIVSRNALPWLATAIDGHFAAAFSVAVACTGAGFALAIKQ